MNANLTIFLVIGFAAIAAGVMALILVVRGDLARNQSERGRWFLAAGLSFGIIAFTIKVAIILVIASYPGLTVDALTASPEARRVPNRPVEPNYPVAGAVTVSPFIWQTLPDKAPAPAGNPVTPEKVELGKRLFHDPNLSANRQIACASCHDVQGAGGDGLKTAAGITGVPGPRNSPTVWNAAFQAVLFWDGRAGSLEEQSMGPPVNPGEMGMKSLTEVENRVKEEPSYRAMFDAAFGKGTEITIGRIAAAIASYERTLITPDTPYDRFIRGDNDALSAAQKRGMGLFQSVGCVTCHSGPNFSGASLFDPSNPYRMFPGVDTPYKAKYDLASDKGKAPPDSAEGIWRIPSLRNVELTGPYFHNGSVDNLAEAVRVMAASQLNAVVSNDSRYAQESSWLPERKAVDVVKRRFLTDQDISDLVAFLQALTSDSLKERMAAK